MPYNDFRPASRWAKPTAGTETVDPLEFLARLTAHIPNKHQVMTRLMLWRRWQLFWCGKDGGGLCWEVWKKRSHSFDIVSEGKKFRYITSCSSKGEGLRLAYHRTHAIGLAPDHEATLSRILKYIGTLPQQQVTRLYP